ncbi:hypothetical protein SUGI_0087950 [Cryptomeria japonica]|nr:hypothetical protein SUGI_0087950 [Cryptomeria japonica]
MNAGLVDYGRIGHSIGSHKFYPICNIKREGIARLRDPYTRGRRTVIPAMEQLKPQIMATKGNEKQSEVDPNNVIPSFEVAKELLPNALVWASLHGFVVGDKAVQRSGHIPGVGLTHAPFSLFPAPFPETCWSQACDLVPLFNELMDRVQQELAKPNVLERFINNKDDALKLRKCFAGLWSLHSNAKIIQDAITMPEAFVLKPQREGGGNNIYGFS